MIPAKEYADSGVGVADALDAMGGDLEALADLNSDVFIMARGLRESASLA